MYLHESAPKVCKVQVVTRNDTPERTENCGAAEHATLDDRVRDRPLADVAKDQFPPSENDASGNSAMALSMKDRNSSLYQSCLRFQ